MFVLFFQLLFSEILANDSSLFLEIFNYVCIVYCIVFSFN